MKVDFTQPILSLDGTQISDNTGTQITLRSLSVTVLLSSALQKYEESEMVYALAEKIQSAPDGCVELEEVEVRNLVTLIKMAGLQTMVKVPAVRLLEDLVRPSGAVADCDENDVTGAIDAIMEDCADESVCGAI